VGRFKQKREAIIFICCLSVALVIAGLIFYKLYSQASDPMLKGNNGYVSDEIWYADSARNILRDFFGFQTRYIDSKGYAYYTIVFSDFQSRNSQLYNLQLYVIQNKGQILEIYSKIPALAFKMPANVTMSYNLSNVTSILYGYPYPDQESILNYYNLEHPPLGKYLIGLSMIINGDYPLSWRLPSILFTSSLPLIIFFTVRKLENDIVAAICSAFLLFDTLLFNEGFLALLDVYLAFFIALSLLSAVYNRLLLSSIFIGLAAATKFSGAFLVFPMFIYLLFGTKESKLKIILTSFIIPILTWFFVNIPIILVLGIREWIQSVLAALSWHTTSRPIGPPTSFPWEWLYNKNPFYFHFNPDYSASVNVPAYILSFISLFLSPYLMLKKKKEFSFPALWLLGIFLGYSILPLLGNTTLYSFYAFALMPMIYSIFPVNILSFLSVSPKIAIKDLYRTYGDILKQFFSNEIYALRFLFSTSILISFIFHLPPWIFPYSIYSDIIHSIFPRQGIGSGNLGFPYIDYLYEYPVLDGIITYIAALISRFIHPPIGNSFNPSGLLIFYISVSSVIAIAGYYMMKDLIYISKKINGSISNVFYFLSYPSFLIYAIYNWDLLAIALTIRSLRLYLDKRIIISSVFLSLAIAAKLYPLFITVAISREIYKDNKSILKALSYIILTVSLFVIYNIPFMLINFKLWYDSIIGYHINWYIEGSWLILLYGNPFKHNAQLISLILVIFFTLFVLLITNYKKYFDMERRLIETSFLLISLAIFSSYIHTPQQQLLFLPLLLVLNVISLIVIYVMDLLNALIILTWFNYKELGLALFGYYPPDQIGGVLHYLAIPTMFAVIRDFIILAVAIYIMIKK